MTLFRLDASIRAEGSASREIADIVEQEWLAAHPGDTIEAPHIGVDVLPADAWGNAVTAGYVAAEDRTAEQEAAVKLATTLTDELVNADADPAGRPALQLGCLAAHQDLVRPDHDRPAGSRAGAAAGGKPVVLVTVRGGGYAPGTPKHGWDHSTPYLRRMLGDLWGADLTVVERELTLAGVIPAMEPLRPLAAQFTPGTGGGRAAGQALGLAPVAETV